KGDQWTSKWTYKDLTPASATDTLTMDKASEGLTTGGSNTSGTDTYFIARRSTYISHSLRGVMDQYGDTMCHKKDENYDQVTNLFEDTMDDDDLHDIFKPFRHITRVYLAMDQKMGVSRGFDFVNFFNKEGAKRAINKLNGYGYDNLILRDEWATRVVFF
ncbi:hypothetical protein KI387_023087, partial [Taxus chinensis]